MSGDAIVVRDRELREALAVNQKLPDHVLVVGVRRVLSHCPKRIVRSGLWRPDAWPDTTGYLPSRRCWRRTGKLAQTVEEM
jgi:predicted pyridoxine 5'-phosphate oxidase superfamily flavin-nucleotide-binding protein